MTFLGEIKLFSGHFAPNDWLFCQGQLLNIQEHLSLYTILATKYGGDGRVTFALPDLRGRVPIGINPSNNNYASGGHEKVTLSTAELPKHLHAIDSTTQTDLTLSTQANAQLKTFSEAGKSASPKGMRLANSGPDKLYLNSGSSVNMASDAITINSASGILSGQTKSTGQDVAHDNIQPYLVLNFIICTKGDYPKIY